MEDGRRCRRRRSSRDGRDDDGHDDGVSAAAETRSKHRSEEFVSHVIGSIAQPDEEMTTRVEDVSPVGRGHHHRATIVDMIIVIIIIVDMIIVIIIVIIIIIIVIAHVKEIFPFDEAEGGGGRTPFVRREVEQNVLDAVHLVSPPRGMTRIRDARHTVRDDDDVFDEGTIGVVFQWGQRDDGTGEEGLKDGLVAGVLGSTLGERDRGGRGIVMGGEGVSEGVGDVTRDGQGVFGSWVGVGVIAA